MKAITAGGFRITSNTLSTPHTGALRSTNETESGGASGSQIESALDAL